MPKRYINRPYYNTVGGFKGFFNLVDFRFLASNVMGRTRLIKFNYLIFRH